MRLANLQHRPRQSGVMSVPTVFLVGEDHLPLVPEYLNLGSVVVIAPDRATLARWREEQTRPLPPIDPAPPEGAIVDMAGRRIIHDGASLPLSDLEFRVLGALLGEPQRAWSFRDLRRTAWGDGFEMPVDPYTVKALVQRLRAKLATARAPISIEAVRGYGFRATTRVGMQEVGQRQVKATAPGQDA